MTSYLRKTDPEYRRAFEVAEEVIRRHAARGKTLTYGAIRDAVVAGTGTTLGHNSYATFLDDLNRETWGRTRVAKSAIVVNADTGQHRVSSSCSPMMALPPPMRTRPP